MEYWQIMLRLILLLNPGKQGLGLGKRAPGHFGSKAPFQSRAAVVLQREQRRPEKIADAIQNLKP